MSDKWPQAFLWRPRRRHQQYSEVRFVLHRESPHLWLELQIRVARPVPAEEVVKAQVHQDAGKAPQFGAEGRAYLRQRWMLVCVGIDGPVQAHAPLETRRQLLFQGTLEIVSL